MSSRVSLESIATGRHREIARFTQSSYRAILFCSGGHDVAMVSVLIDASGRPSRILGASWFSRDRAEELVGALRAAVSAA